MLKRLTADMRRYIVCAVSALFFLITDFSSITETTAGSHRRIVDQQNGSNWDAEQQVLVFERQAPAEQCAQRAVEINKIRITS
jgi:hypothetical protein